MIAIQSWFFTVIVSFCVVINILHLYVTEMCVLGQRDRDCTSPDLNWPSAAHLVPPRCHCVNLPGGLVNTLVNITTFILCINRFICSAQDPRARFENIGYGSPVDNDTFYDEHFLLSGHHVAPFGLTLWWKASSMQLLLTFCHTGNIFECLSWSCFSKIAKVTMIQMVMRMIMMQLHLSRR